MTRFRAHLPALALAVMIGIAGCRDREITSYRAPKDPPPSAMPPAALTGTNDLPPGHPPVNGGSSESAGASMASTAVPTANGADLFWTAPATWKAKAGSAMRKGSYSVSAAGGEADLSITAFPGSTGGLAANLNRWRGQVGLGTLAPAEVEAAVEKFSANGLDFVVVDYAGGEKRLLGAVVMFNGNSWFFKLLGPDAVVAAQKAAFVDFLHTVKAP